MHRVRRQLFLVHRHHPRRASDALARAPIPVVSVFGRSCERDAVQLPVLVRERGLGDSCFTKTDGHERRDRVLRDVVVSAVNFRDGDRERVPAERELLFLLYREFTALPDDLVISIGIRDHVK